MSDLRFPIGEFNFDKKIGENEICSLIDQIEALPQLLKRAFKELKVEHQDSPYRPGGWTIRQLIHHIADGHMNAYIILSTAITYLQLFEYIA